MEVVCNHLIQVCPAGNGQWHNSIVLATDRPNTLMFNNIIYECRCSFTLSSDGQWKEISFSFNRRHGRSRWRTEHYVRTGKELWILLRRTQSLQQYNYNTTCGTFHNVTIKLLRLHSCIRGVGLVRYGAVAFDLTSGFFWNPMEDLPSEEESDLFMVHASTTILVLLTASSTDGC